MAQWALSNATAPARMDKNIAELHFLRLRHAWRDNSVICAGDKCAPSSNGSFPLRNDIKVRRVVKYGYKDMSDNALRCFRYMRL